MSLPKWATTVTPFSKILALFILIVLPFVGFILGMKYQQLKTLTKENVVLIWPTPIPVTNNSVANPAAVYCKEQGGKSEIITAADGSQSGQCVFSDGRKCDEWKFFKTKLCK